MTKYHHKIAFIVPTRNRPELLSKLLKSLQEQTVPANQIIVVDGSDEPIESEIRDFLSDTVSCIRVFPPGLTKQRNAGIQALGEDITLAGFLDDDMVLEEDAVEAMLHFWESCPDDVGGSSFNITNNPVPRSGLFGKLFRRAFCLGDGRQGGILRSGICTAVSPVLKDTYTEWLSGGATVWRRHILDEFKYDEWFEGGAYVEDVDFSLTVAKTYDYKLVVLRDAKAQHFPPPFNPKKCHSLGRMVTQQRYHFARKHAQFSIPRFYWATFGVALGLFISSIPRRSSCDFLKALGSLMGLFDVMRGNLFQTDSEFRK